MGTSFVCSGGTCQPPHHNILSRHHIYIKQGTHLRAPTRTQTVHHCHDHTQKWAPLQKGALSNVSHQKCKVVTTMHTSIVPLAGHSCTIPTNTTTSRRQQPDKFGSIYKRVPAHSRHKQTVKPPQERAPSKGAPHDSPSRTRSGRVSPSEIEGATLP